MASTSEGAVNALCQDHGSRYRGCSPFISVTSFQNTSECRSLWLLTVKHRGRQNPITNPAHPALPSLPSAARLKASHMRILQTCAEAPSSSPVISDV